MSLRFPQKFRLLAVSVTCFLLGTGLAALPIANAADIFETNLIVNGNAESGSASTNGGTVSIPGWDTRATSLTVAGYGATLDTVAGAAFMPPLSVGPPAPGSKLFVGGMFHDGNPENTLNPGSAACGTSGVADPSISCATQTIDVSSASKLIDTGDATFDLSGWFGGFQGQNDNARLTATFVGDGTIPIPAVLRSRQIGPVLAADRANADADVTNDTKLLQRSTLGTVPAGTRSIEVRLDMSHVSNFFTDGYADSLSLVLHAPPATGISSPNLRLLQDGTSSPPGVTEAAFDRVRLTDIPEQVAAGPDDAPIGKSPIGKSPIGKSPIGKSPIGKSPIGKSPIGKSPIGKSPIGKSPIGKSPIGKSPIGKSPLSSFILLRTGGWPAVLANTSGLGGATPQSVTWDQLLNDPYAKDTNPCTLPDLRSDPAAPAACPSAPLPLTMDQILWANSPFADVSLLSILMGDVTWNDVAAPTGGWCAEWNQTSHPCTNPSADLSQTILESEANGLPSYLTSLPTKHVGDISDPTKALFWNVSLIDLNVDGSFLASVPISSIPAAARVNVVDCTRAGLNCSTDTLGDAYDNQTTPDDLSTSALRGDAAFADLGTAVLGNKSLTAIEIAFLDPRSISWEDVPLASVPWETYPSGDPTHFVSYSFSFDVDCRDSAGLSASVHLPNGFRFKPRSAHLGPVIEGEPTPLPTTLNDATNTLNWNLSDLTCTGADVRTVDIRFQAMPGFNKGTFGTNASVQSSSASAGLNDAAPLTVRSGFGFNHSADEPEPVASNTMLLVHPTTDPQYFSFTADPGDEVQVSLSHQGHDGDIVLYAPDGASSEPLLSANAPLPVAFGKNPLDDPASNEATAVLPPESLQDVPIVPGLPVAGISNFRGTETDAVTTTAPLDGGPVTYTLQLNWFNHDVGPEGEVAIIRTFGSADLPPCQARSFPFAGGADPGVAATSTPAIGPGVNTLLLFDQKRTGDMFGGAAATGIKNSLTSLVSSTSIPGVNAQIVNLDIFPAVNAAFAAADSDPCSPAKNNSVVKAINDAVDSLGAPTNGDLANVRNVVIVGDQYVIPHAQLLDETFDGNERDFAGDTFFTSKTNELGGAFARGYFFSDAPYGTRTPLSVLGKTVYVPQWAVGRLAGSNQTIKSAIDAFVASGGLADPRTTSTDPRTALVTDYDGFSDGGLLAFNALQSQMGTGNVTRLTGAWTRQQYADALFNSRKDIVVQNGHHDQYRMLPGALNGTNFTPSELFTTQHLSSGPSMSKRLILSIGCHFALDFPAGIAPTGMATDQRLNYWAKAYFDKGAAVLVGNLGYGYFDTKTTAFDERLLGDFVGNLDKFPTTGEALRQAEVKYFTSMASFTPYDRKVLQQTIMWGFPMTRMPGAPAPVAAAPASSPSLPTDPISNLPSTTIGVAPAFTKTTLGDGTQFFQANDGTQATHPYPILPLVSRALPTGPSGQIAKGAVPLSMTYTDDTPYSAAFANATIDSSNVESAPPFEVGGYPSTLASIGTAQGADGSFIQRLNVTPGVFRPTDATADSPASGLFRKFTNTQWLVTYGSPASSDVGPTISATTGIKLPSGNTAITADVTHQSGVARVFVQAFRTNGTVDRIELSNGGAGETWSGGTPGTNIFEYWVFALSNDGTSASTTNKAVGYVPQPPPPPPSGGVTLQTNPDSPGTSGWFSGNVDVSVTPASYEISVDKNNAQPGPRAVTGDGVHVVDAVAPDGTVAGSIVVPIDASGPTDVLINAPQDGAVYLLNQPVQEDYQCVDAGAGCTDDNPGSLVDTSTVGRHTFTVSDLAGHSGTTVTYFVRYKFTGFFQPIDDPRVLNVANAGRTIPVKWQITDYNNVGVSDPSSFQGVSVSPPVSCGGTTDTIETYASATNNGPQYLGNGNWLFNWQTKSTWASSCRAMELHLKDGTGSPLPDRVYQKANFKFK